MALLLHSHLHPHAPRLLRHPASSARLHLRFKTLSSSSSSSSSSPARTPPPLYGPSLRRGRAPPDHRDPFSRLFDLAALRVPAAACAPLERRLRGHLLNWPRIRNVARVPNDQGLALALSLPSPARSRPEGEESGPAPPTAVARREKLVREFNARGFVRFPNLARLSRPAARKRKEKRGGDSDKELTREPDKDKAYAVEVVGKGGEEDADEWKVLVGDEGFGKRAWRMGPTRLLLLDERYAGRRVDELPEAVKVVLDHETAQDGSSAYELIRCQLTLFYNYWPMNEVLEAVLPEDLIIPTGFETVGHIAHLNLRDEHLPHKKLIAQIVLDKNKPKIQTVVNKTDAIQNDHRTMQLEVLAGKDSCRTMVTENGLRFHVDLRTVYWSSRLATERQRLVNNIFTNSDVVCDMFSGVGPLAISAAKKVQYVYANDINPAAVEYLERNIVLNKLERKIETFNMDARRFISAIYSSQEMQPVTQIVMNLPNDAAEFLDVFRGILQNSRLKPHYVLPKIHVYGFSKAKDPEYDFHEVNTVRQFYENLVPSYTIYDIDCPDYSFRKFTDDGKYLVAFSRNHQDLIVYRPIWLTYSCNKECDSHDLPPKAKKFDSFFKELYSMPLASSNEYICKDFFLYMECHQFGLFATSTAQSNDSSATEGAIHGVPSIEKITFYLVRLEDGVILDEKAFCNDFINLAHSIGAYLYEDLLCIVSLRYQTIHILQIRDSGNLVEVRKIGAFCREDDELFLHSHVQTSRGGSFLPGIKQRLLSFIFRRAWSEVSDQTSRVQHLKKKFYFHFQDYVDLIIWKVSRSTDQNLAFFAVYNMETTDIVSLYQNSSEELYSLFEHFYDHFHANPQNSSHGKFISSHSNDGYALEQLRIIKNKASSSSQFVKKMMASLPYTCQSQSPSPYFDLSLFRYDEKLISAVDRHRHCTEHPIKFISARPQNLSLREKRQPVVKFKIKPGPDSGTSDSRAKRISSFLFHPFFPLALSIQQTYMQPTVVNIHFRR